jgi:hypothetical protein
MKDLKDILKSKKFLPKKHGLKHEWQAFAYKTWKDYSGNPKELPNVIRHFKRYNETHRHILDAAYNFCVDYEGRVPKIKLFYWKFWEIYKRQNPPTIDK